ncbi:GntR family transcriptional regulator [Rhodococcus sp. 1168]|uniref:GntR family transcriptional regulator n=1 Tax=Rhodococcus sp. 1168 TaxID=2018041 RepID=UPI0020CB0F31|nr:GntR family transcriptional regulator [Rhodococcus sp. 1168]
MSSRVGSSANTADPQAETDARTLAGLMGSVKIEGMPLYRSLANQLRRIIADGTVPAGKRLPPERVMSAQLGVSRVTVTSAYRELREQGWAAAVHGAGTFVAVPSDGGSWVSMMGSEGSSVLDFVNAAPEASPLLADALVDAVSSLAKTIAGHGYTPPGTSDLRRAIADRYSRRGLP